MTAGPVGTPASVQIYRWNGSGRLDEFLALIHAAFDGMQPPSSVLRETLSDLAARLRVETALLAQVRGDIVGSVFCAIKSDRLYLTRMAVAANWRRRGVGSALLGAATDEARRAGAARLTLRARQSLPDNRAYFERRGFVVTSVGRDEDRPPYYAMECILR